MGLREYLNVISARRWVIVRAVLVVTVAAVIVSLVVPKQFAGEAKVLISEKDTGAALLGNSIAEFSSQPERGLQTQVQLMQLRPLAEAAIRELGLEASPEELLSSLEILASGQTNVVTVRAVAASPEQAMEIANTMADLYVEWSRETKRESIKAAADEVESRLNEAEVQVLALGAKIASEGKTDELAAELSLLTGTYSTLADRLEQLRINEQLEVGTGRVVSPAVVDERPIAPQPVRNGLLGVALGLILGLGMAFLYEYLDNTIKSNEEAEKIFGAPVLGTIPLEKFEKGTTRRLTIVEAPGSSVAESYRVLRNSLDFINFEHEIRTLLVTSAAPAEGKSSVAANLAASLSQAGKKVVLVSCDFRRPTTQHFFAVNNIIGLSDVLLGTHSLKSALQRPGDDSLLVLTAGKMPPNPSELLGSLKMQVLIKELEEWADWVIIDSPPLLAVADPAAVARWADGVLLVMQAGKSTRDAARKAVELLAKVGSHLAGVAVWGYEETRPGGYGYGYGSYAGSFYYSGYYSSMTPVDAKVPTPAPAVGNWEPELSPGRQAAALIGRVLGATLGFIVILAMVSIVAYLLDGYFDWGLVELIYGVF